MLGHFEGRGPSSMTANRRERWEAGWVARTGVRKGQDRGKALSEVGQRMRKREWRQGGMDQWHFKTVQKKSWWWWVKRICALGSKAVQVLGGCSGAAGAAFVPLCLGMGCAGAAWLLAPMARLAWSLLFSPLLWGLCSDPSVSFCAFFLSSVIIAWEEQ